MTHQAKALNTCILPFIYLSSPNGDVFEGEYKDGEVNGVGTYTYKSGKVEQREYKMGKFVRKWQNP